MRFDTLSTFCDKQTLSGSTTDSTNVLDLGKSEIAEAQQCYVVVTVDTKVTAATNVALRTSSDNTTYYTVASVDFPANSDVARRRRSSSRLGAAATSSSPRRERAWAVRSARASRSAPSLRRASSSSK